MMNDSGGGGSLSGSSGGSGRSKNATNYVPVAFQLPKDPIADLNVSVLDGRIVKPPKGIDPRIKCTVVVEGAGGDTDAASPQHPDWKTEFKFPITEVEIGIEVVLGSSHLDLVTQEARSNREGIASLKYSAVDFKDGKEKSINTDFKKNGKGKATGSVSLSLRYYPRPHYFAPLEQMFLESEDFTKAIFEVAKSIDTPNEFAKSLLFIYWCNGQEQTLLRLCIEHEISIMAKAGDDITQLLRGSTISMYILSEYMKTLCEVYMRELLQPLVKPLAQGGQRFEVDPAKLAAAGNDEDLEKLRKRNQKNLLDLVSKFIKKILGSYASLPPDMGELCRMLKKAVDERYQDNGSAWTQAAGALVFLRFICPAIAAPESAGLVQGEIGPEGRRCLVLVTKVLQNLVNNVDFGDKEDYMTCMNPFIEKYRSKPAEFYQQLLKKKNGKLLEERVVNRRVPETHLIQAAKIILAVNAKSEDKLVESLSQERAVQYRELVPQLKETLEQLEREAAKKATFSPKKKRDSNRGPPRPKSPGTSNAPSSPSSSTGDMTGVIESSGVRSPRAGQAVQRVKEKRGHHPRRHSTGDADSPSMIQHPGQSTMTPPPSPLSSGKIELSKSKLKNKPGKKKSAMSSSAPPVLLDTDDDDDMVRVITVSS